MALPTLWVEFTEACIQKLTPLVHFISTPRVITKNENIMNKKKTFKEKKNLNKMLDP